MTAPAVPEGMKRCSKCGEIKLVAEFFKHCRAKDGLQSECKTCRAEHNRKYREENREKRAEYNRKYREENREKRAEYYRKYRDENREKRAEYAKKYYDENREKRAEYAKKYYDENREKHNEYTKKYNACVKSPNCKLVGNRGAEFVTFVCDVCGKPFRRLKSKVLWDYEHYGYIPYVCSRACLGITKRKDYIPPNKRASEKPHE